MNLIAGQLNVFLLFTEMEDEQHLNIVLSPPFLGFVSPCVEGGLQEVVMRDKME